MKKVISLFVITALVLPLLCVPISATEVNAVEYIVNNVDALADVYAQLHPDSDEVFEGQSVELLLPVTIISTNSTGTYIDFDGDNGYMVVQGNNDVIAWEVSGDLTYLKELESTYFSIVDGFGYLDGGSFVLYEIGALDVSSMLASLPYQGQDITGDGAISDYSLYMLDRYDSHYQLSSADYLNYDFEYVEQADYVVYSYYDFGVDRFVPEGNCVLSSVYAALNYFGVTGDCNFPSSDSKVLYRPQMDPFYEEYSEYPEYEVVPFRELPSLYYAVRYRAIIDYGYVAGNFNPLNVAGLVESAASTYSNSIDATLHAFGTFESCVVPELAQDDPVIICLAGSSTYGSHGMVVTGYRIYGKNETILGINYIDYVCLLEVNDNWTSTPRYLDWTTFTGTWAFISLEVE